jgi:CelD/BcsL family acetyltransferase involved in cellulose biosynthesis
MSNRADMSMRALDRAYSGVELGISDPRWLDFVSSSPRALPYHHPAWAALFAECYGFRTFAIAIADRSGRLFAGLPLAEVRAPLRGHRWVSLPFTDYLPPLAADDVAVARLVDELDSRRAEAGIRAVEVRADVGVPGVHRLAEAYAHVLRLQPDAEAVFRTFKKSQVQGAIQKAQREGVSIRRGERPQDLTHVFFDLHVETRRRHGIPVQPRRFFELLWTRIVEPGLGFVLLAEVGGRAIAGAVFLTWNGTVVYKYSAARREDSHFRPTNLILWTAVQAACAHRDHTFDFGRTDPENDGLRAFKRGWGTEEKPLVYTAIADKAPPRALGTSRLLEALVRRSPTFLVRALGAIFYRYAG